MPDKSNTPGSGHRRRSRTSAALRLLGYGLVFMGLVVIIGWASHEPTLTQLGTGFPGLPYSTAIGLVLTGLALLATRTQLGTDAAAPAVPASASPIGRMPARLAILSGLLMLLGALALLEWYAGLHLGLSPNPVTTQGWAGWDSALYRMHPLAGFGFITIGLIFVAYAAVRNPLVIEIFHALALLMTFLGLLGLLGGLVRFDEIFSWLVGPIFLSGIGYAASGLGLLLLLNHRSAQLQAWGNDDGKRIATVASTIIVLIGLAGFISGLGVLYRQSVHGLEDSLALSLREHSDSLEHAIRRGAGDADALASRPAEVNALQQIDADAKALRPQAELRAAAGHYLADGFSAIAFRNAHGAVVARAGTFAATPRLSVALTMPGRHTLLWEHGFVLRSRTDVIEDGIKLGSVESERPLPPGTSPQESGAPGQALDLAICAPASAGKVNCFPFRSTGGHVLRNLPTRLAGSLLPVAHALNGQSGLIHAKDYRGIDVIAAYRPVGSLGLGMVLKTDAATLYAPIARRTASFLLFMMGVATISMLLLRVQILPMVRKMSREIEERKLAEERHRLVLENGADAVLVTDPQGRLVYANQQAVRLLGYGLQELSTMSFPDIAAIGAQAPADAALPSAAQGHMSVKASLRRKDGGEVPVEISAVHLPDGNLYSACRDITERKKYEDRLEYQATHDALTGLANRNLLTDRMEQSIIHARRTGRWVAAMLLDLDRFKLINDSLGHAAGDALLQEMAGRLSTCVRPGDTVARLGGDEFMVVMSDLGSEDDAAALARKLLDAIERPVTAEGHAMNVSASLGVSMFPRDGESAATLFKNADVAMYRAKELGRGGFQFYGADMNTRILERVALESALRHAVEHDQLELYYQPKVNLAHGRVVGAEALIRWRHPERGLVPPAEFIPLAEESALITLIGDWVIQTACLHLRRWREQGLPPISVAVNVSARQFEQQTLCKVVERALGENRIPAELLELEVTESAMMDTPERTIAILHNLKKIGVRIALDDFGTGYSSLSYLKLFPIDSLKIDQSFVRDITYDPNDAAIARMVIILGHTLNEKVIAEGVETEAQLRFLQTQNCDEIQGFLFSAPLPAEEFVDLLREGRCLKLAAA